MSETTVRALLEPEAIQLIEEYDIAYVKHGVAQSAQEATEIANKLGYPVVLKIVSHDVPHKSDCGGVALGLESPTDVHEAYDQILDAVREHVPDSVFQGMLVCKQAPPGVEVIVGALHDDLFGPALMFGLGGVFTEVLKDVSFRVAPLQRDDAKEMIREIQGFPLLAGVRGRRRCDIEALTDLLLRASAMIMAQPDIQELDLNPVRVYNESVLVLDVRVLTYQ